MKTGERTVSDATIVIQLATASAVLLMAVHLAMHYLH